MLPKINFPIFFSIDTKKEDLIRGLFLKTRVIIFFALALCKIFAELTNWLFQ